MATESDLRSTILGVVNEARRKMGYSTVANLSADKTSLLYLDYLNDTIAEVADYGDNWPQLYTEVIVTASATAIEYEVNASAPVKKIHEIHIDGQISPLYSRSLTDIRLLERTSSRGVPRQFVLAKTSGINPIFRCYPAPDTATSGKEFNVGCYVQPRVYVSGDASVTPPFSSRLLTKGILLRALADEAGTDGGENIKLAATSYSNGIREEYNRWTGDTGDSVTFKPYRM